MGCAGKLKHLEIMASSRFTPMHASEPRLQLELFTDWLIENTLVLCVCQEKKEKIKKENFWLDKEGRNGISFVTAFEKTKRKKRMDELKLRDPS